MLRRFCLAAVLAAALACTGCGIKGPLVRPPAVAATPADGSADPSTPPANPPQTERKP
ncbi:MAG: hypothetical protein IT521_06700 [Burkholderiales bacterium]|nr:hypothetical protein [Burkholderiales bacterium]